jgi:hypothetical protein
VADTGAPWNIPYAEPTDLVRDWPELSEDVADAVAAGLTAAGNAGIGPNAVQAIRTAVFDSSTTSYVDVTGLEVTITPSTATSRILVAAYVPVGTNSDTNAVFIRLVGGNLAFIGDAAGTDEQATGARNAATNSANGVFGLTPIVIDSPNSASPTTYKVQIKASGGTVRVGRGASSGTTSARLPSSIIAIEVAE